MNGEKQNTKLENMIKNDEGILHRERESSQNHTYELLKISEVK